MSFALQESLGIAVIAIVNGIYVYPHVKNAYRKYYSLKLPAGDPTHFVSLSP